MHPESTLQTLFDTLPQTGRLEWISVRPARRADLEIVEAVEARCVDGLAGDRYAGKSGKRQVTIVQAEHIDVIASVLGRPVRAEDLRRNLLVSGINLLALKDRHFRIGAAVLEYTGLCHPCSFMEESLGPGGYNAVRGHGGITARIITGAVIHTGDTVSALAADRPGA